MRRCGWKSVDLAACSRPVWARGDVEVSMCPRSFISGESEALLEEFWVRRRWGATGFGELTARQADAFAILEKLAREEAKHGQRNTRRTA